MVLIDNYDSPLVNNLSNPNVQELYDIFFGFYSTLKKDEAKIRFALLTGEHKIQLADHLFGGLNNLTDLTLRPEFAGMLGFSEAEVREYFADRIPLAAAACGLSEEELMAKLLKWYDGYRFSKAETHVCNPVSLASFFANGYEFANYWDDTGTPSVLLKLGRHQGYDYEAALEETYDEGIFAAYELDRIDLTGMLWQTGYLTIKEVRQSEFGARYRLDFPDLEVRQTFLKRLVEIYGDLPQGSGTSQMARFLEAIRQDDLDGFLTCFQAFLARIPYEMHLSNEKYYQTVFYVVFSMMGIYIEAESHTNAGRIDAFIKTATTVFIFEFKLNRRPVRAISQIRDRRYYEKFLDCGLPIVLVGANFDSAKGQLDHWGKTRLAKG